MRRCPCTSAPLHLGTSEEGQVALAAVMAVALLVVIAAALTDGLYLLVQKAHVQQVASSAALKGASVGRDWWWYTRTGQMRLDGPLACATAEAEVEAELGIDCVCVDSPTADPCQVMALEEGGTVDGFPPGASWASAEPAVGVYVALPVDTVFLGFLLGSSQVTVHVFAAAGVPE